MRKAMKKRVRGVLLVMAMLASMLYGCGSSGGKTEPAPAPELPQSRRRPGISPASGWFFW